MDAMVRLSYARTMGLNSNYCRFIPGKLTLKELNGDRIYIYESVVDGGCGKVVGYLIPDKVIDVFDGFVECSFIEDFCRDVLKNDEYAKLFAEALNVPFKGYKSGSILRFALDPDAMTYIRKTGEWPPLSMNPTRNEARFVLNELDKWLYKNGFLNDCRCRTVTRVKCVEFFDKELPLQAFSDVYGNVLTKPPTKLSYVIRKE